MTEQNAYDAQIRRIAEILAKKYHGPELWDHESPQTRGRILLKHIEPARAMVAEIESKVRPLLTSYLIGQIPDDLVGIEVTKNLIKRGLIPLT